MFTKNPASGHKNIKITPNKNYAVQVSFKHLGTFQTLEKAIDARDSYRYKNGYPKAEY